MTRRREETEVAWLTKRSRELLAECQRVVPVRTRPSAFIEAALEEYAANLRAPADTLTMRGHSARDLKKPKERPE